MEKKKIGNIIRYSIGILFIIGMLGMTSDSVLAGIFMGLFGVSLLPVVYDKFIYSNFKLDKSSYLHIILPILLFFVMCVFMPETEVETNTDNTVNNNVVNEEVVKEEDNETTEETTTENETTEDNTDETVTEEENKQEEPKEETTNTKPSTSNPTKQPTQQTNTSSDNKGNENKEETTTPSAPVTTPTVTPQPEPEPEPTPTPTPAPEPEQETTPSAPTQNSRTVYRTPTGKRYHLDPECGGKNSRATTLDEATSAGLTPCQKCAM